jgi:outer membrane protein assembly factor BamB/Icc-related predicted phosphoesterase
MKELLQIILALSILASCQTKKEQAIKFALIADIHVSDSAANADLKKTVEDINTIYDLEFVVLAGDITEMGSDEELTQAKQLLDNLDIPWYIIPGNHDTKWSESGNTSFKKIFGDEKFVFEVDKYLFVGCSSGPNMRMAPGLVPREHIVWLDSIAKVANSQNKQIIFVNHYPLNEGLANWYEVIDILKGTDVKVALCGHGHRNKVYDFEGIPGVMGRSNLTTKRDTAGFNIVTIENDTMYFSERISGIKTKQIWHKVSLNNTENNAGSLTENRPDFTINNRYSNAQIVWSIQDKSDIGSGLAYADSLVLYTNTTGYVNALDVKNGDLKWQFKTHEKIYSTPAVQDSTVVFSSTDGNIYALDLFSGEKLWEFATSKAIVASPVIDGSQVLCGSSEGVFRSLDLKTGQLIWENTHIEGFVETIPLVDGKKIYFGTWDNIFYALNKINGEIEWQWTNGKGRLYAPAACNPIKADGKIFIVAPDRYTTALDAENGNVVWRSNEHIGRESIGLAEDKEMFYIKDMNDSIHAYYTHGSNINHAWSLACGFGYEISPSPIVEKDDVIFVPTQRGTLYAVDKETKEVVWKKKLSNAIINNIVPIDRGEVLTCTMDGKIAKINFQQMLN